MKISPLAALLLVLTVSHASAFTKSKATSAKRSTASIQSKTAAVTTGATYTTDGSLADVQAAINNASAGDTVNVPAGTFTWGDNGAYVNVFKAVTLSGAGIDQTNITVSNTGGNYNGVCRLFAAGAIVENMTFNGSTAGYAGPFTTGGGNGWRITNIKYNHSGNGYFIYCLTYGLIDNCIINNPSIPTAELIFMRGPANSWQTPNSMGTADAVYIEDCTFNAIGYVCDANSNARVCVRNCTMTLEQIKIDGHGKASNTPPRGVRQVESYRNQWTQNNAPVGSWDTHELRGGTGMVWGNSSVDGYPPRGIMVLNEYAVTAQWPNFGSQYQTLYNYPIDDQIGVGEDPKVAASEPMYLWNNTKAGVPMNYGSSDIPAGAISLYQTQTGNPSATFTMQDIIMADRDYYSGDLLTAPFNGSSGVGVGTVAQMNAITPTKTGVGFWVTDQGEWDSTNNGPDGQLYVWNGSAWVLKYTPYTYPHPLRTGGSVLPAPKNLRVGS